MQFDEFSNGVIGCALDVHRELGQGYWSRRMSSALHTDPS